MWGEQARLQHQRNCVFWKLAHRLTVNRFRHLKKASVAVMITTATVQGSGATIVFALVVSAAHTPSDVLGGMLLALLVVLAVRTFLRSRVAAA